MSTITKEWLQQKIADMEAIRDDIPFGLGEDGTNTLAALRISLASLEAEPVAWLLSGGGAKNNVSFDSGNAYADPLREVTPLYTAPPAPVSVPDAMEMDDDFDSAFEHGKAVGWNAYRAAMLQGAENAESRCTIKTAPALDSLTKNAESRCGNSPVIQDGWVACVERMPEDDDFVYIWPRPDFGVELHVGQYCECHPKGDGWYAQVYEQNYGIEWCPITVTHWMPLPAAPQQEVKP